MAGSVGQADINVSAIGRTINHSIGINVIPGVATNTCAYCPGVPAVSTCEKTCCQKGCYKPICTMCIKSRESSNCCGVYITKYTCRHCYNPTLSIIIIVLFLSFFFTVLMIDVIKN